MRLKENLPKHSLDSPFIESPSIEDEKREEGDARDSVRQWKMTIAPEERANVPAYSESQPFRMPGRAFAKLYENKENLPGLLVLQAVKKQLEELVAKLRSVVGEDTPTGANGDLGETATLAKPSVARHKEESWAALRKFPFQRAQKAVLSLQSPNVQSYATVKVNTECRKLPVEGLVRQKRGTP